MRILGIDPGSRTTGYGVVEQQGNRLIHVTHGQINTTQAEDLPGRLKIIHDRLMDVIAATAPDAVAVEEIFINNNPRSAIKLGQARGVALLVGVLRDLPVFEYSALQVKSAVVGYGKADKKQVQQMVKMLINLPKPAPADASDALAVAICHTHRHATLRRSTSSPMETP